MISGGSVRRRVMLPKESKHGNARNLDSTKISLDRFSSITQYRKTTNQMSSRAKSNQKCFGSLMSILNHKPIRKYVLCRLKQLCRVSVGPWNLFIFYFF